MTDAPRDARGEAVKMMTSEDKQRMLTFLTTEHAALQTARSSVTLDINGRTALYLGSVSSGVVALAFIGQVSDLGQSFNAFAFVLFPALLLMGVVTFLRILQSTIEDTFLLRAINRIRHFYVELVPAAEEYLSLSVRDDSRGALWGVGARPGGTQLFLYTTGMIAMINSVIFGVFIGLAIARSGMTAPWSGGAGVTGAVLSVLAHAWYQIRTWNEAQQQRPALFPSDDDT